MSRGRDDEDEEWVEGIHGFQDPARASGLLAADTSASSAASTITSIIYFYFIVIVSTPCYHAILATIDLGYLLTKNFLNSSNNKRPIPNAIGKNQCATGTIDVARTSWNFGTYKKNMAIKSAKMIAGTRYQLKRWLTTDRRRVRSANRLNHCLRISQSA